MAQEVADGIGFSRSDLIFASAKEGVGVADILEAVVRSVPAPDGPARCAPARLDLRLQVRLLQGRHRLRANGGRPAVAGPAPAADGHWPVRWSRWRRAPSSRISRPADGLAAGPGRLCGHRPEDGARLSGWATPLPTTVRRQLRRCRDITPPSRMVFAGMYSVSADDYPLLRGRPGQATPERCGPLLRAGVQRRPGAGVPLWLPGPASYGDSPGASRAGVRPRPAGDRAQRRVPAAAGRTAGRWWWTIRRSYRLPRRSPRPRSHG